MPVPHLLSMGRGDHHANHVGDHLGTTPGASGMTSRMSPRSQTLLAQDPAYRPTVHKSHRQESPRRPMAESAVAVHATRAVSIQVDRSKARLHFGNLYGIRRVELGRFLHAMWTVLGLPEDVCA